MGHKHDFGPALSEPNPVCFTTDNFMPTCSRPTTGGFGNGMFNNISMGQGQEMVAINAVNKAARDGHWVVLQNIHLMQDGDRLPFKGLEGG